MYLCTLFAFLLNCRRFFGSLFLRFQLVQIALFLKRRCKGSDFFANLQIFSQKNAKKFDFFTFFNKKTAFFNQKQSKNMRKKYLEQLYALARLHKLVNTKGEFATFIGIDGSTLSHAFTEDGRVNLENIITRAEHALLKAGVSLDEIPSGTTSVRERLEELLKSYKINISQFEKEIGVANGTIRRIGDNISANLQEKISTRFPTLNMDWLVYGVGNIIDYGTNTGQIRDDRQTAHDNNAPVFQNTGRGGNNVTQGAPASTIDSLIAEMRAQREASEKKIDRLLTIIENMQK